MTLTQPRKTMAKAKNLVNLFDLHGNHILSLTGEIFKSNLHSIAYKHNAEIVMKDGSINGTIHSKWLDDKVATGKYENIYRKKVINGKAFGKSLRGIRAIVEQ